MATVRLDKAVEPERRPTSKPTHGAVHLIMSVVHRRTSIQTFCGKEGLAIKNAKNKYKEKGKPNFTAVSMRAVRSDMQFCKDCTGKLVHKYKR